MDDRIESIESPAEIPFQQLVEALLNIEQPFKARYLYRLSDLEQAELDILAQALVEHETLEKEEVDRLLSSSAAQAEAV